MTDPTSSPRFLVCLPYTLIQEGPDPTNWSDPANFSNDPNDPGGTTQSGITQGEYDQYRLSQGDPTQAVQLCTQTEGYAIYYNNYWMPYCPILPIGLDLCFFDTAVNQGQGTAIKILQVAVGVTSDGQFGPLTQAAVTAISNLTSVIGSFTTQREAVYQQTRNYNYFGTDWMRRAEEIGAASERAGVMQVAALAMHRKFLASTEYLR